MFLGSWGGKIIVHYISILNFSSLYLEDHSYSRIVVVFTEIDAKSLILIYTVNDFHYILILLMRDYLEYCFSPTHVIKDFIRDKKVLRYVSKQRKIIMPVISIDWYLAHVKIFQCYVKMILIQIICHMKAYLKFILIIHFCPYLMSKIHTIHVALY